MKAQQSHPRGWGEELGCVLGRAKLGKGNKVALEKRSMMVRMMEFL